MNFLKTLSFSVLVIFCFICASSSYRINSKLYDKIIGKTSALNNNNDNTEINSMTNKQTNDISVAYVKASIPIRIFQCMQRLNILKCMKIFILQRMERSTEYTNSGNVTADFLDQILTEDKGGYDIFDKYYLNMKENEIDERLLVAFQKFFKGREIKLHFIPGMVVKVVPNAENSINLSVKKASTDVYLPTSLVTGRNDGGGGLIDDGGHGGGHGGGGGGGHGDGGGGGGGGKKKKGSKTAEYLIQFGVPALMMPAILMGTVLPFVLPAIKMATIVSGLINNGALLTAIMMAAKSAAFTQEKPMYYNPGYHRDMNEMPR